MLKRSDALEVNFVDSAARSEFKMSESSGSGESRIYVGSNENELDDFFELENIEYFFSRKEDLNRYLRDSREEFLHPTQDYRANITEMYNELKSEIDSINEPILKFKFRKKWDNQRRYFLVLIEGRNIYNYIKDICLPRITKFSFIKFTDDTTGKKYIYLVPQYFNSIDTDIDPIEASASSTNNNSHNSINVRDPEKQRQFRNRLLEVMPACPFTHIADERLLIACHIKPFSVCVEEEEQYDYKNGITMTPTFHVLFDQGLISIDSHMKLLISPFLSNRTRTLLNIREGEEIRIQNSSLNYIEYHRNNVFCRLPSNFVLEDTVDGSGYSVIYEE